MSAGWDPDEITAWVEAVREEQRRRQAETVPTRDQLIAELTALNAEAMAIKDRTSPAARDKHAQINHVLDRLIGL